MIERSDEYDTEFADHVEALLPDGLMTGFVLFATFIDRDDGGSVYLSETMVGQTSITTLGMLEAAASIERRNVVAVHFDDD